MGTWSSEIFGDDLASDIRQEFLAETLGGTGPHEAARRLMAQYGDSLADPDEGIVVVSSLASLLLSCGIRFSPVYEDALRAIRAGEGMERWQEAGPGALAERVRVLDELANRIQRSLELAERFPKPRRAPRLNVGDILQIPLLSGQFAYGHYVHTDPKEGLLLAVLRDVYDKPVPAGSLDVRSLMFPPVFCSIQAALREGMWQIVGKASTGHFVFRKMKSGIPDKHGVVHVWWIYDGKNDTRIDGELPPEYKDLEDLVIYPPAMIETRIAKTVRERSLRPRVDSKDAAVDG